MAVQTTTRAALSDDAPEFHASARRRARTVQPAVNAKREPNYGKLWCIWSFSLLSVLTSVRILYGPGWRKQRRQGPGARANRGKTGEPQLAAHGVEKTAADIQLYTIKSKIAL